MKNIEIVKFVRSHNNAHIVHRNKIAKNKKRNEIVVFFLLLLTFSEFYLFDFCLTDTNVALTKRK